MTTEKHAMISELEQAAKTIWSVVGKLWSKPPENDSANAARKLVADAHGALMLALFSLKRPDWKPDSATWGLETAGNPPAYIRAAQEWAALGCKVPIDDVRSWYERNPSRKPGDTIPFSIGGFVVETINADQLPKGAVAVFLNRENPADSVILKAPGSDDPHAEAVFNLHRQRQGMR